MHVGFPPAACDDEDNGSGICLGCGIGCAMALLILVGWVLRSLL